jgi:hypothetical protein
VSLTDRGWAELGERLAKLADHEITDASRFFTIVAFLSLLPDAADREAVLRRRLDFLQEPASFDDGERALRAEEMPDPYRRGMLLIARATSRAERAWLHDMLDTADSDADVPGTERSVLTADDHTD